MILASLHRSNPNKCENNNEILDVKLPKLHDCLIKKFLKKG